MTLLFNAPYGQAYVNSVSPSDEIVHWPSIFSIVDIFVNPANTQGYPTNSVLSQASGAATQWTNSSNLILRYNTTNGTAQDRLNEIYFSTNPTIFGGGSTTLGITQVYYKNNTGEILEADILINDGYTFSTTSTDKNYLGNVITHELGHLIGLGHSQVIGSSMFYTLSRGQHTLSADDSAGAYSIYPYNDSTKASLSGKIVGGNSLAGVFGAHVMAISLKTGQVGGAAFSGADGSFKISGLTKNDQYYIYTEPATQKAELPSKYSNARTDFCNSSKSYRGSFFQSCGSSFEGFPQAVKLNSSEVKVGNITIRCGLDVPVDYTQNKGTTPATFDLMNNVISGVGNSFVGYFSSSELNQLSVADYFRINLENINWDDVSSTGNLYLELKVLNQTFYSTFKANISIKRDSVTTNVTPKYIQNSDGWLNLETIARVAINRSVPSDNDFEVTVTPEVMSTSKFPTGIPYTRSDYFPSYVEFEDSLFFYLVSASIVRDNGDGTYSLVSSKNDSLSDNTQCPDAINTYSLTNYSLQKGGVLSNRKKDDGIFGCGSVDLDHRSGGGPGGFMIGLILSLFLGELARIIIKRLKERTL